MRTVSGFIEGILVEIYDRAEKDEIASKDSDVPIFKTTTYIKKKVPNSRDIYDQPVKPKDRDKYKDLFVAFEKGQEVILDGTPIEEWPQLDIASIETLKALSIYTIQAAAGMPETSSHRLPLGLRNINVKAQKWLSQGNEAVELRKQNTELMKRIEALENGTKRKPGRPRKTEAA